MKLNQPLSLSSEFLAILDQLENSSESIFITGRAGTGKSTLLQLFRNTTKKRTAVVAPTGIAALNVKGQTIHSFFGFPPKMLNPADIGKRKNWRMYQRLDVLIIDEISMVRADMMDNIDLFLRRNRGINEPFGGVQLLLFGDLFQLPPVVASEFEKHIFKSRYESQYFFSSKIINGPDYHLGMIELQEVYRQSDRGFINLLDNIRMRAIDYDDMETLNDRHQPIPEDLDYFITLCSRNGTANEINTSELAKLDSANHVFSARISGDFSTKQVPTDLHLTLKIGAQIMFVKNDPKKKFVNGTIGKVESINGETIIVSVKNDLEEIKRFELEQMEWEIIRYTQPEEGNNEIKTKIMGTFMQYPVKLAWAITIHKSQGKTFDTVIIDMGNGAFEYGQTYVALSRCRTLQGIYLKRAIKPTDIMVDNKVAEYFENKRYHS